MATKPALPPAAGSQHFIYLVPFWALPAEVDQPEWQLARHMLHVKVTEAGHQPYSLCACNQNQPCSWQAACFGVTAFDLKLDTTCSSSEVADRKGSRKVEYGRCWPPGLVTSAQAESWGRKSEKLAEQCQGLTEAGDHIDAALCWNTSIANTGSPSQQGQM